MYERQEVGQEEVKEQDLGMTQMILGSIILKIDLPMEIIDEINKAYDDNVKNLAAHNKSLAGKIEEEKLVTDVLSEKIKQTFVQCFAQYLRNVQKPFWGVSLNNAWINEMRENEYNPFHFHTSKNTDLGLSSVLVLKRPDSYGKEVTNPETPSNGYLEFVGGNQDPLGVSQYRVDAQVGELYIFPYTMLHGVYPFNGDGIRRTLSYNCDLVKPPVDDT
jgi:hypothetical protein